MAELGTDLEVKEEVVEQTVNEGPEDSEVEEEWPSLGLDLEVKEEVVEVEEQTVDEGPKDSEVAEEWPSLGLDLEVKEEVVEVEEQTVDEGPEDSEVEEEWPSVKSIPGLELSELQQSSESSKIKPPSRSVADDASDSSPLGELRFRNK